MAGSLSHAELFAIATAPTDADQVITGGFTPRFSRAAAATTASWGAMPPTR